MENKKAVELREFKKEYDEHSGDCQTIVFCVRMKVPRRAELANDPEMFRLYWTRRIREALKSEGDVRFAVLI